MAPDQQPLGHPSHADGMAKTFAQLPSPPARRLGRFSLHRDLLFQWKDLLPIMAHVVVVDARWRGDLDTIEYLAYSPLFDETAECLPAPDYEFIVDATDLDNQRVSARRR